MGKSNRIKVLDAAKVKLNNKELLLIEGESLVELTFKSSTVFKKPTAKGIIYTVNKEFIAIHGEEYVFLWDFILDIKLIQE